MRDGARVAAAPARAAGPSSSPLPGYNCMGGGGGGRLLGRVSWNLARMSYFYQKISLEPDF